LILSELSYTGQHGKENKWPAPALPEPVKKIILKAYPYSPFLSCHIIRVSIAMEEKDLSTLIQRYLDGNCTAAEKLLLEQWYTQLDVKQQVNLSEQELLVASRMMHDHIFNHLFQGKQPDSKGTRRRLFSMLAAACIAGTLLLGAGLYLFFRHQDAQRMAKDVAPGGNKAVALHWC
jgi:hypothetical protein